MIKKWSFDSPNLWACLFSGLRFRSQGIQCWVDRDVRVQIFSSSIFYQHNQLIAAVSCWLSGEGDRLSLMTCHNLRVLLIGSGLWLSCSRCHKSQVGILSKRLDIPSWFLANRGYPLLILHRIIRESVLIYLITVVMLPMGVTNRIWVIMKTSSQTLNLADFFVIFSPCHVNHRNCCQLSSTDDHSWTFTLSVHLCSQHNEHDAAECITDQHVWFPGDILTKIKYTLQFFRSSN